ncbi:MAG: ATP-binding protein [Planctomycetes bacterium]|nr:ATP-binding protein [Planctomycetota bacterium]
MKCTLKYEAGKWFCSSGDLFKALEAYSKKNRKWIDPELEKAITAFHSRYYPDERDDSGEKYPWNAFNKVNIRTNTEYLEKLKKKVVRHDLTWHWRLLLPYLSSSLSSSDSIVLCVSQIRQWQLVSCFHMEWPSEKNKLKLLRSIRSEKKNLLRPPVFGKSHRITRWEVYASFYIPEVLCEIKKAVNKAEAEGNTFRLAHILGRYDTYIKITNPKWGKTKEQFELDIEQIIDLDPEHEPAQIEDRNTDSVCRPYGLARLPQFKEVNTPKFPKAKSLLFSSDNYCRAFEQVSDVLNDTSARQVLVIAPPGSGKEYISEIFHTCRKKNGHMVKTSLAGLDEKAAAFQLFNLELDRLEKRIKNVNGIYQPSKKFKANIRDGAIFKALGGTLIIDELDKANDKVRAMLLRFLESDDVAIPGTSIVLKIPKEMRPLYVFAGSKTKKEFLQLGPIDFWSRITHIVEMQHPLELGEVADRLRVAEDYVRLFWFEQVEAFFKGEKLLKVSKVSKELFEPLRKIFADCWNFFVSREVGDFVARELAEAICGQGKPIPSVRTIRGTVSRCFYSIFHSLLYHKKSDAPLEIWAKKIGESETTGKEPFIELHKLMGNSLKQQPIEQELKNWEVNALEEIRMLIRSSVSIQV